MAFMIRDARGWCVDLLVAWEGMVSLVFTRKAKTVYDIARP